jgi:hypothetical protein
MAKAVIINSEKQRLKRANAKDYAIVNISEKKKHSSIKQVLPFRVKFINVGVPGYSQGNVPPIGIAIIGFSNYIL